jgi:hypothetical protein
MIKLDVHYRYYSIVGRQYHRSYWDDNPQFLRPGKLKKMIEKNLNREYSAKTATDNLIYTIMCY